PAWAENALRESSALCGGRAAPSEGGRHEEIPEGGDDRAAESGHPVGQRLQEEPLRHREIDEGANAAGGVEGEHAAPHRSATQSLVAVGEDVIEEEIARHGGPGGDALTEQEILRHRENRPEHAQMHADAGHADRRKKEEARRQQSPREVIEQQHEKFRDDARAELALAIRAASHAIGQLDDPYFAARGGDQIEQYLEAAAVELAHDAIEERPA